MSVPGVTQFDDALRKLESSLDVPVVPGELRSWLASANAAIGDLRSIFDQDLRQHDEVFDEIVKEDPAMAHRVRHLQQEDQRLTEKLGRLEVYLARHLPRAEAVEPREELESPAVDRIRDDGLALVRDIRKQEVALATWLQEAYQRDRGVAD